jgi:putative membrane protein
VNRIRKLSISLPALAGLLLVGGAPVVGAADTGNVVVQSRESVDVKLSPTGQLRHARVYDQVFLSGSGRVTVTKPTSTRSLRNLQGWSRPSVSDGAATWTVDVDGSRLLRTVADYDRDLPVTINAEYLLDGAPVTPRQLVGKSGEVSVTYTVRNLTSAPTEVSYRNATYGVDTETIDLPIPLVGSMSTTLPSSWSAVEAPGAAVAGDGRGGTVLSWSMALFEPLGATEQTLTYSASVRNAVVAPATLQVVPVAAGMSPINSAEAAYGEAAESLGELPAAPASSTASPVRSRTGSGRCSTASCSWQTARTPCPRGWRPQPPAPVSCRTGCPGPVTAVTASPAVWASCTPARASCPAG